MIDKTQNPAEIYLVPVFDGDHDHVWCDTPAPGEGMREEDATRYLHEDIYLALQAQVEQLQMNLKRAITAFRQYELSVDDYPTMKHKDMMTALNSAIEATPTQCLSARDAEIKAQAVEAEYRDLLHVVANQYDGNDSSEWSIGANHVFRLFAKEVTKRANQLRQQAKGE